MSGTPETCPSVQSEIKEAVEVAKISTLELGVSIFGVVAGTVATSLLLGSDNVRHWTPYVGAPVPVSTNLVIDTVAQLLKTQPHVIRDGLMQIGGGLGGVATFVATDMALVRQGYNSTLSYVKRSFSI